MSSLLGFLIALLLLVSIHEWGHFWTARKLGVPVVRFSIGMGGAIWQRTIGGVDYRLGWLPLGGYVMFADVKEHTLTPEQAERSFAQRSLWVRSAIVAAGPLVNLLLAWLLMVVVLMAGVTAPRAWLAPGAVGTPWATVSGDQMWEVVALNETPIAHFDQLPILILRASEQATLRFTLRNWAGDQKQVEVEAQPWRDTSWTVPKEQLKMWGTLPGTPPLPAVIAAVEPNSAADVAGLQVGDRIIALNGMQVDAFADVAQWVRAHPNARIELQVQRQDQTRILPVTLGSQQVQQAALVGFLGVRPVLPENWSDRWFSRVQLPFVDAVVTAPERLWDLTVLTLKALGRLITGQSGLEQLAGPIGIAQAAGDSLDMGWVRFVSFLALLSLSLGVLNLLPLPVLDGGHLLLFATEAVRGRPLSDAVMLVWQKVGIVLIAGMTMLAIGSDLQRLFGG